MDNKFFLCKNTYYETNNFVENYEGSFALRRLNTFILLAKNQHVINVKWTRKWFVFLNIRNVMNLLIETHLLLGSSRLSRWAHNKGNISDWCCLPPLWPLLLPVLPSIGRGDGATRCTMVACFAIRSSGNQHLLTINLCKNICVQNFFFFNIFVYKYLCKNIFV